MVDSLYYCHPVAHPQLHRILMQTIGHVQLQCMPRSGATGPFNPLLLASNLKLSAKGGHAIECTTHVFKTKLPRPVLVPAYPRTQAPFHAVAVTSVHKGRICQCAGLPATSNLSRVGAHAYHSSHECAYCIIAALWCVLLASAAGGHPPGPASRCRVSSPAGTPAGTAPCRHECMRGCLRYSTSHSSRLCRGV